MTWHGVVWGFLGLVLVAGWSDVRVQGVRASSHSASHRQKMQSNRTRSWWSPIELRLFSSLPSWKIEMIKCDERAKWKLKLGESFPTKRLWHSCVSTFRFNQVEFHTSWLMFAVKAICKMSVKRAILLLGEISRRDSTAVQSWKDKSSLFRLKPRVLRGMGEQGVS